MTLTELRYVITLAKEKHFGRAANFCHVSQPSLSIAISKLESQLGVIIFERSKNELRVTDIGKKIIEQAQRTLEEADKIPALIEAGKHELDSPLKMGAIHTVAPYLFPKLIPKLIKLAPKMQLILQEDFTKNLIEKLHQGELDVVLMALPFKMAGLVAKELYTEPFVVLMPNTHALSQQTSVTLKDLAKEKILLLEKGHCFRDEIIHVCPHCYNDSEHAQTMEAASLETLRHMVLSGLGITILPSSATQIKYYDRALCVKPFKEKTPKRTIALSWRCSFPRAKAINAVIEAVSQCELQGICLI